MHFMIIVTVFNCPWLANLIIAHILMVPLSSLPHGVHFLKEAEAFILRDCYSNLNSSLYFAVPSVPSLMALSKTFSSSITQLIPIVIVVGVVLLNANLTTIQSAFFQRRCVYITTLNKV